jgi:hypothetical protein
MKYGSPAWHAAKAGLTHYLAALDEQERIVIAGYRDVQHYTPQQNAEALKIMQESIQQDRQAVFDARRELEAMDA